MTLDFLKHTDSMAGKEDYFATQGMTGNTMVVESVDNRVVLRAFAGQLVHTPLSFTPNQAKELGVNIIKEAEKAELRKFYTVIEWQNKKPLASTHYDILMPNGELLEHQLLYWSATKKQVHIIKSLKMYGFSAEYKIILPEHTTKIRLSVSSQCSKQ